MPVRSDVDSILTVDVAADSYDLTDLTTVKAELGISGSASDANLSRWITSASQRVMNYTHRVFAVETVTEVWRFQMWRRPSPWVPATEMLQLRRWPVQSVVSVIEDANPALVEDTDFEVDEATGQIWRLDQNGMRVHWTVRKVTVQYQAGYADDAPEMADLALAVQILVKQRYAEQGARDPNLRQENIVGVVERQWWVPGPKESAMPTEVQDLLDAYCEVLV